MLKTRVQDKPKKDGLKDNLSHRRYVAAVPAPRWRGGRSRRRGRGLVRDDVPRSGGANGRGAVGVRAAADQRRARRQVAAPLPMKLGTDLLNVVVAVAAALLYRLTL
jgi:hypothetical protein